MFRGATTINLDSKGRLAIPTRYRDALSQGVVCTVDIYQPCLLLYPMTQWEIIEQKLAALSSINPAERRIQRLLLGHASECQMDAQGRILLSSTLRQYAGLEKSIMFVGQLNKFELWQQATWQQQIEDDIAKAPQDMPLLAEKLPNLTL